MKKYISHLGYTYVAHNKAEEAAQEAFVSMDRRVITPEQLPEFKRELTEKINTINSQNPRCKDLVLDTDDGRIARIHSDGNIQYSIYGLTSINLYWGVE